MTFEHAIQTGIPSPVLVTPHHSQAKGKDLSLELLKFVAMILIINVQLHDVSTQIRNVCYWRYDW